MLKKLHLKFQVISTSFDPVSASGGKSAVLRSAFPGKSETLQTNFQGFSSCFSEGNQAKNVEKCHRNQTKKTEAKNDEKRPKTGPGEEFPPQGRRPPRPWPRVAGPCDPGPWSPATMGPATLGGPGRRFRPGIPRFDRFRATSCSVPVIFLDSGF